MSNKWIGRGLSYGLYIATALRLPLKIVHDKFIFRNGTMTKYTL